MAIPSRPLSDALISFLQRKVLRTDRSRWNRQYERGQWDGLEQLDELARFSVLAGYVQFMFPDAPAILEVGGGEGILAPRIGRDNYGRFIGTDVSDAAIARAQDRFGDDRTVFRAVDMNELGPTTLPGETFDLIIFNESLYYLRPMMPKLTAQYLPMLKPGGLLMISLNTGTHADSDAKWAELDTIFRVLHQSRVETAKNGWWVKVLEPIQSDKVQSTK
jgi:SAM-dependent methyltransferase